MMDNQPWTLLVLAGDGIGPEVTAEALRVLDWFAARRGLALDGGEDLVGGDCHERHGVFITDATMAAARAADAVLFGAEGGSRTADIAGPGNTPGNTVVSTGEVGDSDLELARWSSS